MYQNGDLLIHDLWYNGTDSIYNMLVVKTDAKSHLSKTPEKCLQEEERANKKMYLEAFLHKCRHLLPFVDFVDGLLSVEVGAALMSLVIRLATKLRQT